MFTLLRASLLALCAAMLLAACDDPESAANKKYVIAAERIAAAERATSGVERYKLLGEADALVASILKDHGATAAAVRLSANEKVGALNRQELAKALLDAAKHPDVCLAAPTYDCLKAVLYQYVDNAPASFKELPDPEADKARSAKTESAIMALAVLRALNEPAVHRLSQRVGPQLAQQYANELSNISLGIDCDLALALGSVHGIDRAKAYLAKYSNAEKCDPLALSMIAPGRLGINDVGTVFEIIKVHRPKPVATEITGLLLNLASKDCDKVQDHIAKILPYWPRNSLHALATHPNSQCQMPISFFDGLHTASTAEADKQAIAQTAASSSGPPSLERYNFALKTSQRDSWDLHYTWLRNAFAVENQDLLSAAAANLRRVPGPPAPTPEDAAIAQFLRHLADALIDGTIATKLEPFIHQYIVLPKAPGGTHVKYACIELLAVALAKPSLPLQMLADRCSAVAHHHLSQPSAGNDPLVKEILFHLLLAAKERGGKTTAATLQRLPDPVLAAMLADSFSYVDFEGAIPTATFRRLLPLLPDHARPRIQAYLLIPSIKAGTDEWRQTISTDTDIRVELISALGAPDAVGEGPWRKAALDEIAHRYPAMAYSNSTQHQQTKPPLGEQLTLLKQILANEDNAQLRKEHRELLTQAARQAIRRKNPADVLALYRETSFTEIDRIWLIGHAAILMSPP